MIKYPIARIAKELKEEIERIQLEYKEKNNLNISLVQASKILAERQKKKGFVL